MNKAAVLAAQARLQSLGWYSGRLDGDLGEKTTRALWGFQVCQKMTAAQGGPLRYPGTLGPTTLRALGVDPAAPERGSPTTTAAADPSDEPPWMREARRVVGLHERTHNRRLRDWLRSDAGATLGDPSKLPWCGDFVATALRLALPDEPFPGALGQNPYWARNWTLLGRACGPVAGAVAVFSRGSGGHVAFLTGVSPGYVHVLGGNQSNRVSEMKLSSSRLLGYRWPLTYPLPTEGGVAVKTGGALSTNEA